MLAGKNITLLVTGSIAAYKSAELVRAFKKEGANVRVAMSRSAQEFITPLTLQTLSGNPVSLDMFNLDEEAKIGHINLADEADVVVVAPATADVIAKARAGFADNIVLAVILATKAPVLFAPAMNVNMWTNSLTQTNVAALKELGMSFVDPEDGELACGWQGAGRLAEVDSVVANVELLCAPKDLKGAHVVVSAGPTREALDPVRFLSNRSSGKMGYAIAKSAAARGARVSLVSGPTDLKVPFGVECHAVESAAAMRERIFGLLYESCASETKQFLFMVAAVADLRPVEISSRKIKFDKRTKVSLDLQPNSDILSEVGTERQAIQEKTGIPLTLVGFAAETGTETELLALAADKLKRKRVDLIVGNFAIEAFASDNNRVWLLDSQGRTEEVALARKDEIAEKIISAALRA